MGLVPATTLLPVVRRSGSPELDRIGALERMSPLTRNSPMLDPPTQLPDVFGRIGSNSRPTSRPLRSVRLDVDPTHGEFSGGSPYRVPSSSSAWSGVLPVSTGTPESESGTGSQVTAMSGTLPWPGTRYTHGSSSGYTCGSRPTSSTFDTQLIAPLRAASVA